MSTPNGVLKGWLAQAGISEEALAQRVFNYAPFRQTAGCASADELLSHLQRLDNREPCLLPQASHEPLCEAIERAFGPTLGPLARADVACRFALESVKRVTGFDLA